ALMRPALERAAQIDAEHPDVHRLTSALARREAAGEATRYRTLAPGPQQLFLRSPLSALLGISQSEIDRELRGATITFMQRGPSPRDERPETGGGGPVSGGTARRQP
ncbi:MAG: hypothetical protein ACE5JM_05670, partial [Armatimonadota bacterium]